MTKISNNVVMITGASSGIGEALAYELAAKGARLILSARRKEELERVKGNCANQENIRILSLDLSDSFAIGQKAKEAESLFGQVDILINCGGISQRDKVINTQLEVDRKIMEVNYFGTIALTKALLPGMVNRKFGHQVVITSATGIISTPLRSSYAASKHALHGFYDALRAEHHDDGLRVSIILPGYVRTQISLNALMGDGSQQNKMDDAQDQGLSPEACAKKIIQAIEKNKEEVYIGGVKEVAGIYLKRFLPRLFSKVIRKAAVT
ncbi:SDR family oxidoreductase [Marinoscillum furvescens]|uniref:Short-subunit dehydrogenase n=1 Tax=Marinoscillum furvescens DSM 4134 TaxID=1122208 RepID=A0A3D9L9Z0_MARFU|nr:SDR family oxidoreductase [Marinoscillum furvescens]REE02073.1 short-subunit dehydrogenase [Marinoscillum furvescens DSM 4134]